MDFEPDAQQAVLLDGLSQLLRHHLEIPQAYRAQRFYYADGLDAALSESGYFAATEAEGFGPTEAALVTERIARLPCVVEAGASLLVVPRLLASRVPRPVALISGDLSLSQRNLTVAKTALVECGEDVALLDLRDATVEPVDSIFGFPYGRLVRKPDVERLPKLGGGSAAMLRQWWRVSNAIETAAALQSALEFTVAYVKERHVFGRPIGSFQAVQHRLAKIAQIARNLRFLALKAAWSAQPLDAHLAAAFAQKAIPKACFDLHQFNGAMGMTTEHLLHVWTMRLRAFQGELGGVNSAAVEAAQSAWGRA
jgi:alkylation response protein AidB-like acyl-CoA dehydrogenase